MAAKCIAFCPPSVVALVSAPSWRRVSQTSSFPASAARWRGVCFDWNGGEKGVRQVDEDRRGERDRYR